MDSLRTKILKKAKITLAAQSADKPAAQSADKPAAQLKLRTGPPYLLSTDRAADAIQKHHGNLSAAAVSLGVGRSTLYRTVWRNPALSEVVSKARP